MCLKGVSGKAQTASKQEVELLSNNRPSKHNRPEKPLHEKRPERRHREKQNRSPGFGSPMDSGQEKEKERARQTFGTVCPQFILRFIFYYHVLT